MIYTARQLEDLHKTNGHVRLPVGCAAHADGVRLAGAQGVAIVVRRRPSPPIFIGRGGVDTSSGTAPASPPGMALVVRRAVRRRRKPRIAAQASETNFHPMPVTAEPKTSSRRSSTSPPR